MQQRHRHGRRLEQLERVAIAHPGLKTLQLDVTDRASIARVRETVTTDFPKASVLINNAGIQLPEHLLYGGWLNVAEDTIATNLLGPIWMVETFLPHIVTREDAAIINVSSSLATVPLPITPTYNATKAAALTPLLLVVEDAQWLDRGTANVVSFLARRLGAEPILIGAAVR